MPPSTRIMDRGTSCALFLPLCGPPRKRELHGRGDTLRRSIAKASRRAMGSGAGVVVVTGAGGDIGLACARALAGRGSLLLQDLDERRLANARQALAGAGISAQTIAGDLCDPAHLAVLARAVAGAGGLRALAHTAGLSPTMADARRIFEVDLSATVRLIDALLPELLPGAAAVLIASQ